MTDDTKASSSPPNNNPSSAKNDTDNLIVLGVILGLFSSNLCALLLLLHGLSWWGLFEANFAALEELAGGLLEEWKPCVKAVTIAWLLWLGMTSSSTKSSSNNKTNPQPTKQRRFSTVVMITAVTLGLIMLPEVLVPYRDTHPIIQRSLVMIPSQPFTPSPTQSAAPLASRAGRLRGLAR